MEQGKLDVNGPKMVMAGELSSTEARKSMERSVGSQCFEAYRPMSLVGSM